MEPRECKTEMLEELLGHRFAKRDLLLSALTHRSIAHQSPQQNRGDNGFEISDNERLEFLGDAVLGLVVGEALFHDHPEWHEGELTRVRALLVSRKHLGNVAQSLALGDYLFLHKSEEKAGLRQKSNVLSNCMEAVIAALYLDGGLDAVRNFARKRVLAEAEQHLAEELSSGEALGNFKSALQELLQGEHLGTPVYLLKSESGPDHRKQFHVEVRLRSENGNPDMTLARGRGTTKKNAEQDAARQALERMKSRMENAEESAPRE